MSLDNRLKRINQTPVLVIAVAVAAGVGFSAGNTQTPESPSDSGLGWEGKYTIQVNGEVIDRSSNVLTYQGQNQIAGKIFNTSGLDGDSPPTESSNFAFIGVGNGTEPSFQDDKLNDEIEGLNLSRNLSDSLKFAEGNHTSGDAIYTLKKTFVANDSVDGTINVNTTGLFFNRSGPSLVSGGSFDTANLGSGDKLTVTHEITISGS
jgi:hypothetical protein